MKKYDIIYADPPWEYSSRISTSSKKKYTHVTDHYHTMSSKQLIDMSSNIKNISKDNCLCFMWTTGPYMSFSIELLESWGFSFKTVAFVWYKQRPNMGAYTMGECEFVLVGKKGKIPKKLTHNTRQFLSEKRTIHSKKPLEIIKRIDETFGNCDKIELFARSRQDGWDAFGDEIQESVNIYG